MKQYTFLLESYSKDDYKEFKEYKNEMLKDKSLSRDFNKADIIINGGEILEEDLNENNTNELETKNFINFLRKNWSSIRKCILYWSGIYIKKIEQQDNPKEYKNKKEVVYTLWNELNIFDPNYSSKELRLKNKGCFNISFSVHYAYSYMNDSKNLDYISGYFYDIVYTFSNDWKKGKFNIINVSQL